MSTQRWSEADSLPVSPSPYLLVTKYTAQKRVSWSGSDGAALELVVNVRVAAADGLGHVHQQALGKPVVDCLRLCAGCATDRVVTRGPAAAYDALDLGVVAGGVGLHLEAEHVPVGE